MPNELIVLGRIHPEPTPQVVHKTAHSKGLHINEDVMVWVECMNEWRIQNDTETIDGNLFVCVCIGQRSIKLFE